MTNFNPVPKPGNKKKKKKVNGWKNKAERMCYYCGTYGAERHEVYGASNRQWSIDHGFQLDLCSKCHRAIHNQTNDLWKERARYWKAKFQHEYEQKQISSGKSPEQTRSEWMKNIGRNYTDEIL